MKRGDKSRRRRTGSTGRGSHLRGAEEGGGQGGRDPGVGERIHNPLSLQTVHTGRGNRFTHTRTDTRSDRHARFISLSHTHEPTAKWSERTYVQPSMRSSESKAWGHFFRGDLAASLVAQLVKNPPAMQETWAPSLG